MWLNAYSRKPMSRSIFPRIIYCYWMLGFRCRVGYSRRRPAIKPLKVSCLTFSNNRRSILPNRLKTNRISTLNLARIYLIRIISFDSCFLWSWNDYAITPKMELMASPTCAKFRLIIKAPCIYKGVQRFSTPPVRLLLKSRKVSLTASHITYYAI